MWKDFDQFIRDLKKESWTRECPTDKAFWDHMMSWIQEHILPEFLKTISLQVDEMIDINPELSEPELFALGTRYIVEFLKASSASLRIYDPHTEQMLSYGSYPSEEDYRETFIPLENSVAGEVVRYHKTYLVPNILKDPLYHDKSVIARRGTFSLMAVPLGVPRFFPHERDTVGVIQIYYPEKDRAFSPLEVQLAELMAKRLSVVVARKKIYALHRLNEKKETIIRKIFLKLGTREGVKMKDVFNRLIPELADIINVESCALFSVTQDNDHVVLDAGYPESKGYHGIGKQFPIRSEPAFELILNRQTYDQASPY
ncbi:MAG: GAF domain-containing protein, partial [Deltaproteobacteria bacterium]|nr:GAF domain-containing protein [Deltaproteobacteria bacterium]